MSQETINDIRESSSKNKMRLKEVLVKWIRGNAVTICELIEALRSPLVERADLYRKLQGVDGDERKQLAECESSCGRICPEYP